jgi:hypothetical protein
MVSEKDLEPYLDKDGDLLLDQMNRFIASRGYITLDSFGRICVKVNLDGACPYFDFVKEIKKVRLETQNRLKGKMKVQHEKKSDEINADEIPI